MSQIIGRIMKDFATYIRHFVYILMLVYHVLAALVVLLLIGAAIIAAAEDIDYWRALYLTMITGLTVGYGDVVPATVAGRITSVLIGLVGVIFFGIVVAVANTALKHMVDDKREARKHAEEMAKRAAKQP